MAIIQHIIKLVFRDIYNGIEVLETLIINNLNFKKKMKKILFAVAAVAAMSLVSCGQCEKCNSACDTDSVAVDSVDTVMVDSIVADSAVCLN